MVVIGTNRLNSLDFTYNGYLLNLAKVMEPRVSFYAPLTLPSPPIVGERIKGRLTNALFLIW
jgi:hypothetical protein